jgi:predicted glycogen debranching enzyme
MTTAVLPSLSAPASDTLPPMSLYSIETYGELHPFVAQEWLLTNGMGAFASSTVVGCNSRRYHGLLCAATQPPVGRIMTLNRVGELLFLDGKTEFLELSVSQFGQNFHPRGDKFLRRFHLDRTAKWEYEVEGIRITKELQLVWQRNLIGLRYTIEAPADRQVELHLLPFVSMRDFHALRSANGANFDARTETWQTTVTEGAHTLHLRADAGQFAPRGDWWFGHTYAVEVERGFQQSEDLYVPSALIHQATGKSTITLWASTDPIDALDWDEMERLRPDPVSTLTQSQPSLTMVRLARAAADFIVARKRPDGKPGTTVIAGYPWFADWGRDTMIALPGLLLATNRHDEARQVLTLFAEYVSQGMIPNRFDDYSNEPSYNTVDASLWFIHACFQYLRATGDKSTFESRLLPACREIVAGYRKGTRYKIKMDETDGLITAGDDHTQLTWMDAKCQGIAFTPRHGKAVEINALWYNALRLLGEETLAEKVAASFVRTFWINSFRGLYDCVNTTKDSAVRPNQIFAASLPHSPLNEEQQHAVVEVVRRELLTPFGLRTLSKSDPHYKGRLVGPPMERDAAYHNGTVWPWLIGPFLEAYLKVHDHLPEAQRQARVWLQPLIDHLNNACIGQVSECFDGDEPHRPVAAPAQAWSVAEVLRIAAMLGM